MIQCGHMVNCFYIANELIELQQRLATAPDDSAAIPFSFNDLPGKTFFEAYHYNENTATYAVLVAQMNGNSAAMSSSAMRSSGRIRLRMSFM